MRLDCRRPPAILACCGPFRSIGSERRQRVLGETDFPAGFATKRCFSQEDASTSWQREIRVGIRIWRKRSSQLSQ